MLTASSAGENLGIVLLDGAASGALTTFGGGVHVTGGGSLVIDSSSSKAAINYGSGSVSASQIDITGHVKSYNHAKFQGTMVYQSPMADPMAELVLPFDTGVDYSVVKVQSGSLTLSPGTYSGGIHISGNAKVTLSPGTYYLDGGGLSISGNGKLTGSGVTIFNEPNSAMDRIFISGNGTATLSAPNSGEYQGLVLVQDPASSAQ
ncbi:MAG TPA: hypothetical protein VMJ32_03020, partial [Pirellulales bacterium]|nr:hypothetical protein [Pirellulales bacterium]